MKRIGVLFGSENSFPGTLVEHINARNPHGIKAEFVVAGAVSLEEPKRYDVIIDRISHEIPFYRSFLKNAALQGTIVINNPFWSSTDDKFVNYTLARKIGVPVPPTTISLSPLSLASCALRSSAGSTWLDVRSKLSPGP